MLIGGGYVDPIYIVLITILAVFFILAGIVVILYRYLQVLKAIERYTHETSGNTQPIRKLQENTLLLQIHKQDTEPNTAINDTFGYGNDPTIRVPDYLREKARTLSSQLYANPTDEPTTKP